MAPTDPLKTTPPEPVDVETGAVNKNWLKEALLWLFNKHKDDPEAQEHIANINKTK
jgi:hypothetical protein